MLLQRETNPWVYCEKHPKISVFPSILCFKTTLPVILGCFNPSSVGFNLSFLLGSFQTEFFSRLLHKAVAQGRRALTFALAQRFASLNKIDEKDAEERVGG